MGKLADDIKRGLEEALAYAQDKARVQDLSRPNPQDGQ